MTGVWIDPLQKQQQLTSTELLQCLLTMICHSGVCAWCLSGRAKTLAALAASKGLSPTDVLRPTRPTLRPEVSTLQHSFGGAWMGCATAVAWLSCVPSSSEGAAMYVSHISCRSCSALWAWRGACLQLQITHVCIAPCCVMLCCALP